jgi:hypothetical protein
MAPNGDISVESPLLVNDMTQHLSQSNHLSLNRMAPNGSTSSESPLLEGSSRQSISQQMGNRSSRQSILHEMENNQFEIVINNYERKLSQMGPNSYNPELQYFFELMKSEWMRLRTYHARQSSKWSIDFVSPEELANSGFFYLNEDRVQCAFCRGIVSGWEPGIYL